MDVKRVVKPSFSVIGIEGSTRDGEGFIAKLWEAANMRFGEVEPLAKRDAEGGLAGIWGVMDDFSRSHLPWEDDFSQGLYLAGVEVNEDARPPEGWTKWNLPGYEYLIVESDGPETFMEMMAYLREENLTLAGAAHDFIRPGDGRAFLYCPIRKIDE